MATHSSVPAWRIPGTGEPGGLPSIGSHRVRHDWSNLAVAAADIANEFTAFPLIIFPYNSFWLTPCASFYFWKCDSLQLILVTLTPVSSGSDCSLQLSSTSSQQHGSSAVLDLGSFQCGEGGSSGHGLLTRLTISTPCQAAAFFLCHCRLMFFIHALPVF